MATISVIELLSKIYGPKGLPFPGKPKTGDQSVIAGPGKIAQGFNKSVQRNTESDKSDLGTPIRKYDSEDLGRYVFLPASISFTIKNGRYLIPKEIQLSNPLIIISGEKEIIETDVVDVGTVFEKVFTKPYDISIICTLIGEAGAWPEKELKDMAKLYKEDVLVTLKCALTDIFLQAKENMIITKIAILDAQGAENVEVIQIDGRSNIDFKLELI